jgi:hypothetical protein
MNRRNEERLFSPHPWRHYRRTFSRGEVWAGLCVLLGLAAVAFWVGIRGQNADPDLYGESKSLIKRGQKKAERGALPTGLTPPGFSEGKTARFGPENVYEKINGREGYYKSFGFQELSVATLIDDGDKTRTVDIELFDQGNATNALGAFSGETPREKSAALPALKAGVLLRRDRNALYLAKGRFYARCIGSDESPQVQAALEHLEGLLSEKLQGEALPWSFGLFVGGMGLPAGSISFRRENAFSFAFASEVHIAQVPDTEVELFLSLRPNEVAAQKQAGQYLDGFASIGTVSEKGAGGGWVKDRYLGQFSGVSSAGRVVYGLRGAATLEAGKKRLAQLAQRLENATLPSAGQGLEEREAEKENDAEDAPGGAADGTDRKKNDDEEY